MKVQENRMNTWSATAWMDKRVSNYSANGYRVEQRDNDGAVLVWDGNLPTPLAAFFKRWPDELEQELNMLPTSERSARLYINEDGWVVEEGLTLRRFQERVKTYEK